MTRPNTIQQFSGKANSAHDTVHSHSLGQFIVCDSQIELPFQSAIAANPEQREKYWNEKVDKVLDEKILDFVENAKVSDTQAPSFIRYGMPSNAYKAWSEYVQEPIVHALYSGLPVSRKQLNTYFAEGRKRLAQKAAEFTASIKKEDLITVKNKMKSAYFGSNRIQRLLTPLGDDGPYAPFSHRAIDLIQSSSKADEFQRAGHLTLNEKTLRLTVSHTNQSKKPDSVALVFSAMVGQLRLRTTSTYLSALNGKLTGIALPSNMSLNWHKSLPHRFWRHAPPQNIPYLETLCNQRYESILDEKHQPIELLDNLLDLHYLESHLCQFLRGSAAINSWKTQSLLKAFGVGHVDLPENLDCLALSHHQSAAFVQEVREKYPQIAQASTKIRQPETVAIQLCMSIKHKDHATTQSLLHNLGTEALKQVKSPSGLSLMQLAAKYNNSQLVNQLVNAGISPNHSHDERSPLILAIQNGAIQSALQLIEQMSPHEIEPLSPNKNHPLHHLVIADHCEREMLLVAESLCMKLARNNQDLNTPDSRGQTPTQIADKLNKPRLKKIIETHAQRFPMMEPPRRI